MTAEQLARRFSHLIRQCLSNYILSEAIEKNAKEPDPKVCHTHDHCDANLVMADAFKQEAGREINLQSDADRELWGQAWTLAKQAKFYTEPKCLKCGKPLDDHRKYTAQDIERSQGATYERPVNGYRSPLSPTLIGQWAGHDPFMPDKDRDGAIGMCAELGID